MCTANHLGASGCETDEQREIRTIGKAIEGPRGHMVLALIEGTQCTEIVARNKAPHSIASAEINDYILHPLLCYKYHIEHWHWRPLDGY